MKPSHRFFLCLIAAVTLTLATFSPAHAVASISDHGGSQIFTQIKDGSVAGALHYRPSNFLTLMRNCWAR